MLTRGRNRKPRGRCAAGAGVLALLVAIPLLLLACDESARESILDPPGGSSELIGTLTFDGQGGPDLPEALVFALEAYNTACATDFSTIHILGTFNDWNPELWTTDPGMENLGGCTWVDEIELPVGALEWKFVTDGGWNNDYVSAGEAGLSGNTQRVADGGDNLQAEVVQGDAYIALLFEGTSPPSYVIATEEEAPIARSSTATGSFSLANLPAGTYEVIIRADGYLDTHVSGVTLDGKQGVDLGTIDVTSSSGALSGLVAFSDSPSPLPTATIRILPAGGSSVIASDTTDATGAFAIGGLATGAYDVEASAPGYLDELVTDVEFVNGQDTDVGTITLDPGCSSAYTSMDIPGDFNEWTPSSGMTEIEACLWADTLTVTFEGDSVDMFMKFRTNQSWSDPDFGTCTSESDVHPLVDGVVTGDVCLVSAGMALAVRFYESGDYEFQLNEALQTFQITLLEDIPRGTILGSVDYEDEPETPPTATITARPDGSTQMAGQTTTDAAGDFSLELQTGLYDLTIAANGYVSGSVEDVEVVLDTETDIGAVTLVPQGCQPTDRIEVMLADPATPGTWSPSPMTLIAGCAWADTVTVAAADTLNLEFRTNEFWGQPQDYGACDGAPTYEFTAGEVSGTTCLVGSFGTPGPALSVAFPASGDYRFELDEETLSFRIVQL
jgi:hypothetical protein